MSASPRSPSPVTIVIVDDDAAVLGALGFALETEGFAVRTFRTAAGVLTAPGIDAAACLVIDQGLPDQSGLDLLAGLRARGIETPAVVITTNPPRSLHAQALSLNTPVVEKPLLGDQLFAVIRSLAAPPAQPEAAKGG